MLKRTLHRFKRKIDGKENDRNTLYQFIGKIIQMAELVPIPKLIDLLFYTEDARLSLHDLKQPAEDEEDIVILKRKALATELLLIRSFAAWRKRVDRIQKAAANLPSDISSERAADILKLIEAQIQAIADQEMSSRQEVEKVNV